MREYTLKLTEQQLRNLEIFLNRATLTGKELFALLEIYQVIGRVKAGVRQHKHHERHEHHEDNEGAEHDANEHKERE